MKSMTKVAVGAALVAALAGAGYLWWNATRTEPIPEQLEAIEEEHVAVVIPGLDDASPLDLDTLRGTTNFFVVIGTWSAKSPEGEALNRALARWSYPQNTRGFIVAEAAGLGLLAGKIERTMQSFAPEVRFPLYVDFEGIFNETFKLPKGHHGFVVLGPQGEVLARHSGGVEGQELEEIRTLLGATEPQPTKPMPAFEVGTLDATRCAETTCAFVFAGDAPVSRADIPGMRPGGFEGNDDERLAQMLRPEVRTVTLARKMKLSTTAGALIGDLADDITSEGWERISHAQGAGARAALGLKDDSIAVVVFDEGREILRVEGLIALHHWGHIADLLEIEGFNDRRPPRG